MAKQPETEPASSRKLITRETFSDRYGPGKTKTYELLDAGEIEAVHIGRKVMIVEASAEAWFARLPRYKPKNIAEPADDAAPTGRRRARRTRPPDRDAAAPD